MVSQQQTDFNRIAQAISYIKENFREQPTLDEVAHHVAMSPFHFQRLFSDWAGVSPKKFLQYITVAHAKKVLMEGEQSLFDVALETGLSGTGRLHDLFVNIEGMTPGEYRNGGSLLQIEYAYSQTPFGSMLMASTAKGICHMAFADDAEQALDTLKLKFPNATYQASTNEMHRAVMRIFSKDWTGINTIRLHLKGTAFQLKVWETLLKIPVGRLTTYGHIARKIAAPRASRAVGTAIGDNPVAFLIPCHRIIQSTGVIGGYHWGPVRKTAIIGWEAAQTEKTLPEETMFPEGQIITNE